MSLSMPLRSRSLPLSAGQKSRNEKQLNEEEVADIKRLIASIAAERKTDAPEDEVTRTSPSTTQRNEYQDPFLDPPPALGIRASSSSMATENLNQFLNDESLIKVEISSTGEHTNFYVPVSLMVSREMEMREAAKHFQISQERWTDSLLFREWRCVDDVSRNPTQRGFLRNGEVVIRLNPEMDCAVSNHSHSLRWKPWLTTCIRAYYNTGTIRVPDACIGSDILLALEYFGIVYTPEQLVFDSFGGYLRVKLWSDYYTHRSQLAQWVVQRLLRSHAKHSHTFVTGPNPREVDIFLGSRKAEVLDGELQLDPTKYGGNPSCSVVHDFFHDEDQDVAAQGGQQASLDELMRDDFRIYLQNSLQGTQVEFRIQRLTCQGKVMPRATLHIDFLRKNSPMSLPSDEERATAVQQPTGNQIKKSPSTASKSNSMFRRVGSLKMNRNKSIRSVPSSEHIYADLDKAAMHQSGRSAPNGSRKGLESLVPSDERGPATTPKVGLQHSTPNDYEVDYGAPMTMIQFRDGDAVSVLTGDWREDDSVAQRSLGRTHKFGSVPHARSGELAQRYRSLLAASESVAGDRSEFMTPVDALSVTDQTVRRKQPAVQQEQVVAPRQKIVNRETTKPVAVEETSPLDVTNQLCGVDLSLSAICSPIPRTPQRKERGTDANNSSNSNTSSTQTAKTEVETDEDEPSLISRVEGFLPDIDLRTLKTEASVQHTETLDDLTAAWLRDAFTLSNYIYDDPIPNEKDEYLQLARQAGEVETPTTKSPTRVKDIIEELMDLDIRDVTGADNEDVAAVFNECATGQYELGIDSNLGKEVSLEVDSKSSRSKRTKTLPPALPKRKALGSGPESSSGSDTVDDSDVTKRATNTKRNREKQRSSKLPRLEEEKSQGKSQERKRKGLFGLLRRKG